MASNIDKVEDKATEDVQKAIKSSKTRAEMETKLDVQNVRSKMKDESEEGKEQA